MFQVEPIQWLQSFESSFLTSIMSTISLLGYSIVYGLLIGVITFGFNIRKGLSIFIILALGGIMTDGLKRGLKFPRPSDIDIRVSEPGQLPSQRLVEMGGANSFWSLPSSEAMELVRIQPDWSYGLPSGHVSAATAFFLGLFLFYRKRPILLFSIGWISLMALSRMYLGRHFIADVIGGVLVGGLAILIISFLLRPLDVEGSSKLNKQAFLPIICFTMPLVLLIPFVEILDADNVGRLLGLIVAYFIINRMGQNSNAGKIWQRLGRFSLSFIAYLVIYLLVDFIMDLFGWEDTPTAELVTTFLLTGPPFIATFWVAKRLNFYTIDGET